MANSELFYKPSGRFNFLVVAAPAFLVPAALVLGFIYSYGSVYIPLVGIVTVVLLGGYTVLTGLAGAGTIHVAKCRNRTMALLIGCASAGIALWANWVTFLFVLMQRSDLDPSFFVLVTRPDVVIKIMCKLAETGWFNIGSSGDGGFINGFMLWAIWIVEAVVIVGGNIYLSFLWAGRAFCENCSAWAKKTDGYMFLDVYEAETAARNAESEGVAPILQVPVGSSLDDPVCTVNVASCPSCGEFHVMELMKTTTSVDNKGNETKNHKAMLKNLLVTKEDLLALRNRPAGSAEAEEDLNDEGVVG